MTVDSVTDKQGKLAIDVGLPETQVRAFVVIDEPALPKLSAEDLDEWNVFVDRTEAKIDDPSFHRHNLGLVESVPSFDDVE